MLLGCALVTPSVALSNNVSGASSSPVLGGEVPLVIPPDSHQVYRVHLAQGDWLIGYAWVPGTHDATASVRVLGPSATDVASDTVASSSPNGILFWQAPLAGDYFCDYTGDPGVQLTRGLFLSRPALSLRVTTTIMVPYNGGAALSCGFVDPLYSYVPYDGPAIGFENVGLSSSRDGVTWTRVYAGSTDVNGRLSRTVAGVSRKTFFHFDYAGSVYDLAGFGEAHSAQIAVIPRFHITQTVPTRVRRGVSFGVSGTLQPKCAAGPANAAVQAHKRGSVKIFTFAARAYSSKTGSTPIRASVKLPSTGTWYVRFRHPADATNGDTTTKWVKVVVG